MTGKRLLPRHELLSRTDGFQSSHIRCTRLPALLPRASCFFAHSISLTKPSPKRVSRATPAEEKTSFNKTVRCVTPRTQDHKTKWSQARAQVSCVLGRRAASLPNFGYSKALRGSGLIWDAAALDRFLTNPTTAVPGTTMVVPVPNVVRVHLDHGVPTGEYEDFLTGFVVDDRNVWGRPVGVAVAHDGALLVSEDGNGTIWRIAPIGHRTSN